MTYEPVVIAGAGIGGLTAALALGTRGIDVVLLEKAAHLRPLGLGINLLPHAVRELSSLGLRAHLEAIAAEPTALEYYDHTGTLLFREPRGLAAGHTHPQLSVHRGHLQMLLRDAITDRLGASILTTDAAVLDFDSHPERVTVTTTAGSYAGEALVGADGISSVVRARLHPYRDPLRWSGITMYRGVTDCDPFRDGHTMAIITAADGVELVTYPIGSGLVNWVLQVPSGTASDPPQAADWNTVVDAATVAQRVADWQLDWLDSCALITASERVLSYPMVDRDPLPHWGFGRVTLLGDAAHPMYPVGANGASQAIVDARVLSDEYARYGVTGLRRYEDRRRPETADVIAANRVMHNATGCSASELAYTTSRYRSATERSTRS